MSICVCIDGVDACTREMYGEGVVGVLGVCGVCTVDCYRLLEENLNPLETRVQPLVNSSLSREKDLKKMQSRLLSASIGNALWPGNSPASYLTSSSSSTCSFSLAFYGTYLGGHTTATTSTLRIHVYIPLFLLLHIYVYLYMYT